MRRIILFASLLFTLSTVVTEAKEIFSCKYIADARISADKIEGNALYDDDIDPIWKNYLVSLETKILTIEGNKLTLGDWDYSLLPETLGRIYWSPSFGVLEFYKRDEYVKGLIDEVTLFYSNTHGRLSSDSNIGQMGWFKWSILWHCNK